MHGVWNFFIERRQFTMLVIASLVIAGLAAVAVIKKESSPAVKIPIATVVTTLRGASPEDVAKLVTKEIEKQVGTVSNIDTLTSSSQQGVSAVVAQFNASADLDKSLQDVKDAVERAKPSLPRDADEPRVSRVSFASQPILMYSLSGGLPPAEFNQLGRDVEDALERVSGVSDVQIAGARPRQTQIVVRREALASYGISIADVVGSISAANASIPVGSITTNNVQYAIDFHGSLDDPSELSGVVVTVRNGAPVYLSDVADIVDGIAAPTSLARVSVNGSPAEAAINLLIYKQDDANITTTATAVKTALEKLQTADGPLSGITVLKTFDQGAQVAKDLRELTQTGIETVILVMLILFLTIGWRESLVAGLSVPLSFVIAFVGLYVSNNSLNVVSLFSLILAIGILVDSGIVITEAIHTRLKKFGNPEVAAKEAIREYAWPLIAGTMTTIAVFIPLFFISGIVGQFIKSIPFTLVFVLLASLVVALGFVPPIAIMFTKREMNKLEAMQEHWNERANQWYRAWLTGILADKKFQRWFLRWIGLAFVLILLLPMFGFIGTIFFPGSNGDYVYLDIETQSATPLEQTDLAARAVEETLYANPDVESFATTVGASSIFSGGGIGGGSGGTKYANITINLAPHEERSKSSAKILAEITASLSGFTTFTVHGYEEQGGPPSGAPVLIKFKGEDLGDLSIAADKGEAILRDIAGTRDIIASNRDDGTSLTLMIDRAKAAQVGLTAAQIAGTLRAAVSGSIATTIVKNDTDIDVLVLTNLNPSWKEPADNSKTTLAAIENYSITTPRGQVLLGSLISSAPRPASATISREDQKNIVTISSYLTGSATAVGVSNEFLKRIGEEELPEGVVVSVGGETEDVNQSFAEMFIALIGGMVLMLAILVLEFNSFRYAGYLLMLIPLSLIGVLGGLALTHSPISFPSLLGVIALAGVIINHAIILVDAMVVRMKDHQGRTLSEVVVDAAASRLRPIVLTTITTVIGMVPLSMATGLWGPLAFSIMFGLSFAMVLTLILTPILIYRHPGTQYWKGERN